MATDENTSVPTMDDVIDAFVDAGLLVDLG